MKNQYFNDFLSDCCKIQNLLGSLPVQATNTILKLAQVELDFSIMKLSELASINSNSINDKLEIEGSLNKDNVTKVCVNKALILSNTIKPKVEFKDLKFSDLDKLRLDIISDSLFRFSKLMSKF